MTDVPPESGRVKTAVRQQLRWLRLGLFLWFAAIAVLVAVLSLPIGRNWPSIAVTGVLPTLGLVSLWALFAKNYRCPACGKPPGSAWGMVNFVSGRPMECQHCQTRLTE
jgi:hypothetical protein